MRVSRNRSLTVAPQMAPPEPYEHVATAETAGLSIAQILAMLRAHRRLAMILVVSIIALSAVFIKLLPKAYDATATMIVSYQVNQGGTEIPSWLIGSYMATQVELMRRPEVLGPVVDTLRLTTDPEFVGGFRGTDMAALRHYAEENLDKKLAVEQGRGSQLLYVTATSRNPVLAAAIANAVADTYAKREHQRVSDPADDRARKYSEQLEELRAKVTAAQQKVTDLRQRTGTAPVSTEAGGSRPDAEQANLVALQQQLLAAQNVRRAAETATNLGPVSANGAGEGSPQIKALRDDITAKELQLSQLSTTYGARHPKVLSLQSDLDQARRKLRDEQQSYLNDARQMEAKLQAALDAEHQKILDMQKIQDQGSKLQLELESSEAVYKRALDGYDQIMFASEAIPTNVSFVSRAAPPIDATKPNKVKLFLGGICFALLFGLSAPILYELLFDRRLHCRDDFERTFAIPVLAQFGDASNEYRTVRP